MITESPAWQPPANLPQTGMAGNLSVLVEAVPNEDFATSTDPAGRLRATVRIPARTYSVGTLGAARALLRAFIEDNGLGGGNLPPTAGRVRLDGKPFAHISYNGRIWRVDGKWKESGQELEESGQSKDEKDCNCKKTKGAAASSDNPSAGPAVASSPSDAKAKRTRKPKAPAEQAQPKAALSDAEAEELANLFAAASAEDKPK